MSESKTHKITLHNNDVLSFEYVIASLMAVCKHTSIQAEQCAVIAHNKGQVDIVSGDFNKMYEILETFSHINVDVSLEQYESDLYR
jgi:ATP-dependent Clp protease adaptor protein ClpS